MYIIVYFLSIHLSHHLLTAYPSGNSPGTTDNLKEIVIGRCWDYVADMHSNTSTPINESFCEDMWQTFSASVVNSSICNVEPEVYTPFLQMASLPLPSGQSMFWQGVKGFVQELSYFGKRFYTLEDSLYGYSLNNLNWCASDDGGDFNYTYCPGRTVCQKTAQTAFWDAASRQFALEASGNVRVMVNGSRAKPYQPDRVFGRVELPAISASSVDKITILVVHDFDLPVIEGCNGTSIMMLQEQIKNRSLSVRCIDDPEWVRFYMCVDHMSSDWCKRNVNSASSLDGLCGWFLSLLFLLIRLT